ncbi:MAG: hypothetical protein ACE5Q6_16050 [Dehalococcoidia bacterium]
MQGRLPTGGTGRSTVHQVLLSAAVIAVLLLLTACGPAATPVPFPTPHGDPPLPELLEKSQKVTALTSDLEVTITESADAAEEVEGFTYSVKVVNHGPQPASMVQVAINPESPAISYLNGDRRCSVSPEGILNCRLGSMLPGDSKEVEITRLITGHSESITNTVTVENVNGLDPDTSNNSVSREILWAGTRSAPASPDLLAETPIPAATPEPTTPPVPTVETPIESIDNEVRHPSPTAPVEFVRQEPNYIVVSALIEYQTDNVTFSPVYERTGGNPLEPESDSGDYLVQLIGDNGAILAGAKVDPRIPSNPGSRRSFLVKFLKPLVRVASIQLLHNNNIIGTLTASPNTPTVRIDTPSGGENFTGPNVTFKWTGSDADGDELFYNVAFSANDGYGWNTIAVFYDETTLTVDRAFLAASSEARIRVSVSDGVNSTETISDRFSVGNNTPIVLIEVPQEGAMFSGQGNMEFSGVASDSEDGVLDGASLVWSSDLDGVLGTDSRFSLNIGTLTEGTHVITLTATDRAGAQATDSVTIHIVR